jgi:hypothetical protein
MARQWWCAVLLTIGGCYSDPDRFNTKQATVLCSLDQECAQDDGFWDYGLERGSECVGARERELERCNEHCDYDEEAARDCVKGLKQADRHDECGLDSVDLDRCAEVYTNCEPVADGEEPLACAIQEPQHHSNDWDLNLDFSCSAQPGAPLPATMIVLVGVALSCRASRARSRRRASR